MAAVGQAELKAWDADTGAMSFRWRMVAPRVVAHEYTPDGRRLGLLLEPTAKLAAGPAPPPAAPKLRPRPGN